MEEEKKRKNKLPLILCYIIIIFLSLGLLAFAVTAGIGFLDLSKGGGTSGGTSFTASQLSDSPAVTPMPTPEPTPVPTPEPKLEAGYTVVSNGVQLASGSYKMGDEVCVSLEELAKANGIELSYLGNEVSFPWRSGEVKLFKDSDVLMYNGMETQLPCKVFSYHEATFVPVEALCKAVDIGLLWDDENQCMYCTPAAGNWTLPEGYTVPVMMYHCVEDMPGADLYIQPTDMDAQIEYLVNNGYTPIWFEDLEHVDQYEKPVILVYDDGYLDNYTNLWPIVQKYNVKVTICMITNLIDNGWGYLSTEQLKEMSDSGLVMIESHTVTHDYLSSLDYDTQVWEMEQSKLDIVRVTGKEPIMLCYPTGMENNDTHEILPSYYRFGVKMTGPTYVTGQDPSMVWRTFIKNSDGLWGFVNKLEEAFA